MPAPIAISPGSIADAAERLRRGGVVAFPTETVYGLGAATFDPEALARIYALKGRPPDNPLIAHVIDSAGAPALAERWDSRAERLAARFWPGPLTLVLPARVAVPRIATGGRATIAIRSPSHPAARLLLEAFGGAISAPSANRSGRVSPTTAAHVAEEFPDAELLILDGGACPVGIESTVIDLSGDEPRLLRPGSVGLEEIRSVVGPVAAARVRGQDASPGTRERHYAPMTPTRVVSAERLDSALAAAPGPVVVLALARPATAPRRSVIAMPADPAGYAARLYAALREADAAGAALIVVEEPPREGPLWAAVHDRLERASMRPQ